MKKIFQYIVDKKWYIILCFSVILLSVLSYGRAIDYNLWRDDWNAIWLYKFDVQNYFFNWSFSGRHSGEFLNLFPWILLFGTNYFLWQGFGIILKIIASFCVGLALYGVTRSKRTFWIASLLYASFFGGLEAFTWLSARLSVFLVIFLCLVFYFYFQSFSQKGRMFKFSLLLFFLSVITEPIVMIFVLPVFFVWELSQRFVSRRIFEIEFLWRMLSVVSVFLSGFFITPFGRSLLTPSGSQGYISTILKNNQLITNYFCSIGNIITLYFRNFSYIEATGASYDTYIAFVGLSFIVLFVIGGIFLTLRRKQSGPIILFSIVWISFIYLPSWLSEMKLVVGSFHRYLALSSVGFIFIISYLISKLPRVVMIEVCVIIITLNLFRSINGINNEYSYRGYQVSQPLLDQQEADVPKNFSGGLFWVGGNSELRGYIFDWSMSGTLPFSIQRKLNKIEEIPVGSADMNLIEKLVCEKNIQKPSVFGWTVQKEPIPVDKIYAWDVTDKGKLKNISSQFRQKVIQNAPCFNKAKAI